MIYLSAQPDTPYFLWQLEIQLINFRDMGINPTFIHVLLGFKQKVGPNLEFQKFEKLNLARVFYYADERQDQTYVSSIRPHIIAKHFEKNNVPIGEKIFYHDCDIIFRQRIDIDKNLGCNEWFVSDTRNYIDSKHLREVGGNLAFIDLCKAVDIDPEAVIQQDTNAGGAQYILTDTDSAFWEKIEYYSTVIFKTIKDNYFIHREAFINEKGGGTSDYIGIQAWCADMWAMLWVGVKLGFKITIHKELDFCWPRESLDRYYDTKILHNSGISEVDSFRLFYKDYYRQHHPYFDNFQLISQDVCSIKYVDALAKARKFFFQKHNLQNLTFLIIIKIDSEDRLCNLDILTRYLYHNFNTNINILEVDDIPRINKNTLHPSINYEFIEDIAPVLHRTKYLNYMTRKANTKFVAIYDVDVIIPVNQLVETYRLLSDDLYDVIYPYSGNFIGVDPSVRFDFQRSLELTTLSSPSDDSLHSNSVGGVFVVNRDRYIEAGCENTNFVGWGMEDAERYRRFKILGLNIHRSTGPLYHLNHFRGKSSYNYGSTDIFNKKMEYLKVCAMSASKLATYVTSFL